MSSDIPLSELMNMMVARLEYTRPRETESIPEERYWPLISLYITLDSTLASLYKQYKAAQDSLATLQITRGADDPMTEVAWDMHDSLRSAIETRLIELRQSEDTSKRVATLQSAQQQNAMKKKMIARRTKPLSDMMTFMLMATMAIESSRTPPPAISQAFGKAS